jgi:HD superfamily phosphodiesterase
MTVGTNAIRIPDSKFAREVMEIVRDTESELLFNHSSRVYLFGALAGEHRGLKFDPELLYTGAMFHDMGLTKANSSDDERFEVDGANAARDFLKRHGIAQVDIDGDCASHHARHSEAHASGRRPRNHGRRDGRPQADLRGIFQRRA